MKHFPRPPHANQGLTLIELMVAMAISAILLLGVATIYSASKRSYEVSDQFAILQENARYALYRLTKEIRMAGYTGCKDLDETDITIISESPPTELESFKNKSYITGHHYDGSAWNPDFDTPPSTIVTSADAITIRKASACSATISQAGDSAESDLEIVRDNCGFKEGDILLISDCQTTDMFTKTNGTSNTTIAHTTTDEKNTQSALSTAFDTTAHVMRAEAITYYIGTDNTAEKNKHLYMQSLQAYGGEYKNVVTQLIPNVENMIIQYGVDTDGDESIDEIRGTELVGSDWDKVLSVYLRLLFYTDNIGNSPKAYTFNGVTHDGVDPNPALPDDQRFRREFITTINLRNRIHYN